MGLFFLHVFFNDTVKLGFFRGTELIGSIYTKSVFIRLVCTIWMRQSNNGYLTLKRLRPRSVCEVRLGTSTVPAWCWRLRWSLESSWCSVLDRALSNISKGTYSSSDRVDEFISKSENIWAKQQKALLLPCFFIWAATRRCHSQLWRGKGWCSFYNS